MTVLSTYIDVAVALPVYQTYTYQVPKALGSYVCEGKRVLVPFGKRRVTGYVLGAGEPVDYAAVKPIIDTLDDTPLFPDTMIPFFRWVAAYYVHPIGNVIKCALPGGINPAEFVILEITKQGKVALETKAPKALEKKILRHLQESGPCRQKDVNKVIQIDRPGALFHKMECCGWIIKGRKLGSGDIKPKMERYVSLKQPVRQMDTLTVKRREIVEALQKNGEMSVADLKMIAPTATRLIKPLESLGWINIFQRQVCRDPFGEAIPPDTPLKLSGEQKVAVKTVLNALDKGFSTYLLAGVTGSGKTEVYMQLADAALKKGCSVLVLVPEIALTSQMERRFRARFGECVAVLHSGLSPGERYDQWRRILREEVSIAIGARSAIFAPFKKVGLVIVDEEHDGSYKQESQLRYNARDLAVVRAKLDNGVVLLGSATPSIQSYHNVTQKNFIELYLTKRVEQRGLPEITVVDLGKNRNKRGIRRFISAELIEAMSETYKRGEQTLLFLNRRGFSSFPMCAACGEPIRCGNCDISLTLHQAINAYKCHYCGYTKASVSNCSACGSDNIQLLGLGTEKVEAAIKSLFPEARVARMDRDTTRRKGAILKLLKGLRKQTIDILVGTQMVAKGHDFPMITLVGIICADLSLNFPDFRAGEHTFQLLAQVAGRAGRGEIPGKVILQTYNPNHFSIEAARKQDFMAFYKHDIQFRKALKYPPFTRMILLKVSGRDKAQTETVARQIGATCRDIRNKHKPFSKTIDVLGPIAAPVSRIAKRYRWQILLKGSNVKALHRFVHQSVSGNRSLMNNRQVQIAVDVDPLYMM